jgi:hypothetical protein
MRRFGGETLPARFDWGLRRPLTEMPRPAILRGRPGQTNLRLHRG